MEVKDHMYDFLKHDVLNPALFQLCLIFRFSVISDSTALIHSSEMGHLEITRFLVESGANLEAKNNEYYTLKQDV